MRDLELARFGLELYQSDPLAINISRAGDHFALYRELDRTLPELERAFGRREAEGFVRLGAHLQRVAAVVGPTLLADPPSLDQLRGAFELAGDGALFEPFMLGSVGDLLGAYLEAEPLKGFLGFLGLTSVYGGPWSQGTGYVYSHHSWGEFEGRFGEFGFARGGMGAISEVLAAAARARGVEIRTGAEVERIAVADGRATGVVVSGGEELAADVIVSNADPRRTFLGMLGESDLPAEFAERVREIDFRGTMGRVHLAVDRLPAFVGFPSGEQAPHRSLTVVGADLEAFERAWVAQQAGEIAADPAIEMTIQSVLDDSLAPAGSHIITTGIQQLPFEFAEGSWDDGRERLMRTAIDGIERYAPGFEASVIGAAAVTPLDLERDYGLSAGNLFHGAMNTDQLFAARPLPGYSTYRAPVGGLYLCGAGMHPGGGVTGAPGHNGARAVLRDLGRPFAGESGTWTARRRYGRYERLGRLLDRPRLQRATTALARQRWLRPVVDRARSSRA
jgi:phytoene dehydrogenase-like protein